MLSEKEKETVRFMISQNLEFVHIKGFLDNISRIKSTSFENVLNSSVGLNNEWKLVHEIVRLGTADSLKCLLGLPEVSIFKYTETIHL